MTSASSDGEAEVVVDFQARPVTRRAVDIDHAATVATHQMVMVVVDAVLVSGRRPRRLNAPDQTLLGQHAQGVEHRLSRHRPDAGAHIVDEIIGSGMRTG